MKLSPAVSVENVFYIGQLCGQLSPISSSPYLPLATVREPLVEVVPLRDHPDGLTLEQRPVEQRAHPLEVGAEAGEVELGRAVEDVVGPAGEGVHVRKVGWEEEVRGK